MPGGLHVAGSLEPHVASAALPRALSPGWVGGPAPQHRCRLPAAGWGPGEAPEQPQRPAGLEQAAGLRGDVLPRQTPLPPHQREMKIFSVL